MKVLYVISVMHHGNGGHINSLNHIVNALDHFVECAIVVIGPRSSLLLESNNNFLKHIYFNGINLMSLRRDFRKIINSFKPSLIHCFDYHSMNVLNVGFRKLPNLILSKCGGANPFVFPFANNIILFSRENENWFKANKKFVESQLYLIPNRVNKIEINYQEGYPIKPNNFSFVRIARIGRAYHKSIIDSIELIKRLNESYNISLFIIGIIEDEKVYEELVEISANLPITFITEKKFVSGASKMLYLADAVIATGRGVMEAASLSIPVLTPVKGKNIPSLISRENFDQFFSTNFSERNMSSSDDKADLLIIERLLDHGAFYKETSDFMGEMFLEYFDLDTGAKKYCDVYNEVNGKSYKQVYFRDLKIKLKSFYSFYKGNKLS